MRGRMAARRTAQLSVRKVPMLRSGESGLEWIFRSLGFGEEGGDEAAYRIFKKIVEESEEGEGVGTAQLTKTIRISRVGTLYHINKFMSAGLVVRSGRKYQLRAENLELTLEEVEADFQRAFRRMEEVAEQLDRKTLPRRRR